MPAEQAVALFCVFFAFVRAGVYLILALDDLCKGIANARKKHKDKEPPK